MRRRLDHYWLACQINGIVDYLCRPSSVGRYELRLLADEFRNAARRVDAEIARRAGHPDDQGVCR